VYASSSDRDEIRETDESCMIKQQAAGYSDLGGLPLGD